MIHKVNVVKKIAFLLMTMALAGAIVACQGAVTSPATVAKEIGDIEFDVGGSAKKITLTGHFNVTGPKYSATSSKESVAAVSVSGAVLTVTPTGAGTANVEVTADGDEGKVSQTFTVTVNAPTVIVNEAPTVRTISPVPLQVAGTKTIELSDYFTDPEGDALTYTAASSDGSVATVTKGAASMITITAVAAGTAEITVSASDGTNAAVSQTFTVTVTASGGVNERPEQTLIADINDLRREGTRDLDLSMYYDDPDGDDLTYDATSSDEMVVTESVSGSMLTITGFGVGRARITVIASDGTDDVRQTFSVTVGSQAPVVDESLPTSFPLGLAGATKVLNLSKYYDDPEGDELKFDATSSDEMVVTESVSGSMITITAVAPGVAVVTATATDKDNDPVALEFVVTVGAPPVVNEPPRVIAGMVDNKILVVGDTTPLTLSDYFTDPDEGDTLSYSARSSDDTIATVTDPDVVDHTITITAVGVGEAVITIGATDNHHEAPTEATFTVTVGPANNPPTRTSGIAAPDGVSLVLEDEPSWTHDVSRYFMDADDDTLTYTASSSMYATAMIPEGSSMVTITAVAEGMATITVTASDGNGGIPAMLMIDVTVKPAPVRNMPPQLKLGMMLEFKGVVKGSKTIDLDEYFEDQDGNDALITYKVTQDKKEEKQDPAPSAGTSHNVIAVGSGIAPTTNCSSSDENGLPDGTDLNDDEVWICYLALGTAEIEIVAIDALGNKSRTFPVMIAVGENNAPYYVDTPLPDQIGEAGTVPTKLVIGIGRKVINDVTFATHFNDKDLDSDGDEDELTFEVKYYANDGLKHNANTSLIMAANELKMGDPGYGAVRATIIPSPWNGTTGAKFTLELTGVKGTVEEQDVALIASDTYGDMIAMVFGVKVNHDPMAYGAQEDENKRKTLSSETKYKGKKGLTVPADTSPKQNATATLVLVEDKDGYFSDGDGPGDLANKTVGNGAGCVIKSTGGTNEVATFIITETDITVSLEIRAKKIGTKSVTILCKDTFGVETPPSTLTVDVIDQVSGSRQ